MGFLTYNPETGLVVKTKANIMEDLKAIFKQAYGDSFTIVEGTELYTFIDLMSSALAEEGAASKAVYDAFGFMSAKGNPLDVLCSLAGIARYDGESDTQLRARYYKFLYSQSVSTVDGLQVKLLQANYTRTGSTEIINIAKRVKIVNNDGNDAIDFIGTGDLPAHSIAVVVMATDDLPLEYVSMQGTTAKAIITYYALVNSNYVVASPQPTPGGTIATQLYAVAFPSDVDTILNSVVENYKSLGCGILKSGTNNYYIAQNVVVNFAIALTLASGVSLTSDQKSAIVEIITEKIQNIIDNSNIGDSITYSAISACVYDSMLTLGYTTFTYELSSCSINGSTITATTPLVIKPNQYLTLGTVEYSWSDD